MTVTKVLIGSRWVVPIDRQLGSESRKEKTMDEKMKEALKGIYENLTDEQKEKIKACKSPDEMMELAGKWGIELPDEVVEGISGGSLAEIIVKMMYTGVEMKKGLCD